MNEDGADGIVPKTGSNAPAIGPAAIVIHYGRSDLTHRAVASILAGTTQPGRIVIVDNGPDALRADSGWPASVAIFHSRVNLGFAAGVNAGIRVARDADGFWLLNNDAVAEPDAFDELRKVARVNPRALVSSIVLDDAGAVWFERAQFLPWRAHARHEPDPHPTTQRRYSHYSWLGVPYLPGTSLYLPRGAIQEIGWWNERFFLYGEDIDYSIRALRKGWSLIVARSSRVRHTSSSGTEPRIRRRLIAAAVLRMTAQYYPYLVVPGIGGGLATGARRALRNGDASELTARIAGYVDALLGSRPRID